MPSKRIRSYDPLTSGAGGGATTLDVPSARWSEDLSVGDAPVMMTALSDDASVDDALAFLMIGSPEDSQVDDAWSQVIIGAFSEDSNVNDLAKVQLLNVDVPRTGTPDSDLMFDSTTDQTQPTTAFGSSAILVAKGATTTPGSDEKRAYICIDLTGLSNFTGLDLLSGPCAFLITVQVSNSNGLLASNLTCTATRTASKPFTESTMTWNSPPTIGTAVTLVSATNSIAAGGGFAAYTWRITAANLNAALGQWLLLTFTGAGGLLPDSYTIKSREDGTGANRPQFSYAVQRGT